jgi:hypothetical protein
MKRLGCSMLLSAIIIVGVGTPAFAQERSKQFGASAAQSHFAETNLAYATDPNAIAADNYPAPDFSGIAKWYEVVKYQYDFTDTLPKFYLVIKKKVEKTPLHFEVKWLDDGGIVVSKSVFPDLLNKGSIPVGEPFRIYSYAPYERQMPKVKSVTVNKTEGQMNAPK